MTWLNSNKFITSFEANWIYAIDGTPPALPLSYAVKPGVAENFSPSPSLAGIDLSRGTVAQRRMRLNRVTLVLITDGSVAGPGGSGVNDFSFTFERLDPPYTALTVVENVGPISMSVGGTGVSADFDFSESSIAPKGNSLLLSLQGLNTLLIPDTGPASTPMVTIAGTAEWEAMDAV
jgi:hypothetical protein